MQQLEFLPEPGSLTILAQFCQHCIESTKCNFKHTHSILDLDCRLVINDILVVTYVCHTQCTV